MKKHDKKRQRITSSSRRNLVGKSNCIFSFVTLAWLYIIKGELTVGIMPRPIDSLRTIAYVRYDIV